MNLTTKSNFAESIQVSRAAITQACKNENLSLTACDETGQIHDDPKQNKYIDLDADTTKEYLSTRRKKKIVPRGTSEVKKPIERKADKLAPQQEISDDDDNSNLALRKEIAAIKKIQVETELKKLKLAEQQGLLVQKKELGDYCFSVIDALNRRLLNSPLQFIDLAIAYVERDGKSARGKAVEIWTNEISIAIKAALAEIEESLK